MTEPTVHVRTDADFTPSEPLRGALERVALAYEQLTGTSLGAAEVEGFGSRPRLQIGDAGIAPSDPDGLIFGNGCWFFKKDTSCGWYDDDKTSCLGGYGFGR